MLRLNKLNIIGILMILFAVLLTVTNFLSNAVLSLTHPFLEGSSQGKSIILFTVMGSLLLFYPLFKSDGLFGKMISSLNPHLKIDSQKYLKFTIITIFFTYLVGLFIEIWIRIKLGIPILTTFISYDSNYFSSTSLTHSHVFKSVLGFVLHSSGIYVSPHVNTGIALAQYTLPISLIVLITLPLILIAGITALSGEKDIHKVILAFALTLSLIGILDGGLFSTPAMIGLLGLLSIYFIKKPFSLRNLVKPSIILALLIILRLSIGIVGSNVDIHEITIINPSDNIYLEGYDVSSIQKEGNKMIVKIPGTINDKVLLLALKDDLKGKCSGFTLSWDIYTYFK